MTAGAPLTVNAVILAAGASTRLGQPKQALRLAGRTLLERVVDLARESADGAVHVVVGARAAADRTVLAATAAQVHECAQWREGQGASLACGLRYAGDADGVLVLLVDQYRLGAADLVALVEAWRQQPGRPAAAGYAGTVGVPVVWPRSEIDGLIRDGRPGRGRLDPRRCTVVDLPAAAVDLDTPHDLAAFNLFAQTRPG